MPGQRENKNKCPKFKCKVTWKLCGRLETACDWMDCLFDMFSFLNWNNEVADLLGIKLTSSAKSQAQWWKPRNGKYLGFITFLAQNDISWEMFPEDPSLLLSEPQVNPNFMIIIYAQIFGALPQLYCHTGISSFSTTALTGRFALSSLFYRALSSLCCTVLWTERWVNSKKKTEFSVTKSPPVIKPFSFPPLHIVCLPPGLRCRYKRRLSVSGADGCCSGSLVPTLSTSNPP